MFALEADSALYKILSNITPQLSFDSTYTWFVLPVPVCISILTSPEVIIISVQISSKTITSFIWCSILPLHTINSLQCHHTNKVSNESL